MQLRGYHCDSWHPRWERFQRNDLPQGTEQELELHDRVHPGRALGRLRHTTQVMQYHEHRSGESNLGDYTSLPITWGDFRVDIKSFLQKKKLRLKTCFFIEKLYCPTTLCRRLMSYLFQIDGLEYFNTIVVQPHRKLVTNQGRGYHIRCRYQTKEKTLLSDFNVRYVQKLQRPDLIMNCTSKISCYIYIKGQNG